MTPLPAPLSPLAHAWASVRAHHARTAPTMAAAVSDALERGAEAAFETCSFGAGVELAHAGRAFAYVPDAEPTRPWGVIRLLRPAARGLATGAQATLYRRLTGLPLPEGASLAEASAHINHAKQHVLVTYVKALGLRP